MPIRQFRRLEVPTSQSLHERLSREALSYAWSPREVNPIPHEHPELVIERDGNLLAAFSGGLARLAYSYTSDSVFVDLFPPMFEQLLPRIRKTLGADTVRFRLALGSSRMAVEPVLRKLSFKPQRPWLTFALEKRGAKLKSAPPKGIAFRPGGVGDIGAIVRIDREAFPDTPMLESAYRHHLVRGDELLLAIAGTEVVGFALYSYDGAEEGYLSSLAVADAYRGRGIGPALVSRAAKWAFTQGAAHVALRTEEDNSTAIRVYRALDFKHTGSGNDYERPTDPRVIAALKKSGEGTLIRFGGWR